MSSIQKVVLAGATGNLGPAILKELIDANFQVTVFTRPSSTHTFPSQVTVVPVDYESIDSLTTALKGQDALISTLSIASISVQTNLIAAASAAGVQRILPSDFGSDTLNAKTAALPVFHDKLIVHAELDKYTSSGLSYTYVNNGPFLDWGLQVGFLLDVAGKKATIYDGGNRRFSTTTLPSIGKAVVGVLRNPEATANRAVYVQDTALTQNELLDLAYQATGGKEGWTVTQGSVKETYDAGIAEVSKENPDLYRGGLLLITAGVYGEGYGSHFEKLDNELLGLKEFGRDQILDVIKKYVK